MIRLLNGPRILIVFLVLAATCLAAQETVYKWVDKEGIVHFSDEPPPPSQAVSVEIMTTAPSPAPAPIPARPEQKTETPEEVPEIEDSRPGDVAAPAQPAARSVDISQMTLEELDRRCEDARELKIAPLRAAEIAKCKEQGDKDPAWCERFFADYGDGGRTEYGTYRPRMFHDLPECLEAEEERRRRFR